MARLRVRDLWKRRSGARYRARTGDTGRFQYTEWLLAGEVDSLKAHSTEESRTDIEYSQVSQLIAQRAGHELEVSEETWKLRNGDCQYWRTSQFSVMDEPLLIRWVLDPQGRIEGLGAGPLTQAPEVESETCVPPTG